MIFIWTNNGGFGGGGGGPLQYAGLLLFLLQFILPQVINVYNDVVISSSDNNNISAGAMDITFALLMVAVVAIAVWVVFGWESNSDIENGGDAAAGAAVNNTAAPSTTTAPVGSPENPVVIDDDENQATNINSSSNATSAGNDNNNLSLLDRVNSILQNLSPVYAMIAAGFILPLSIILPLFLQEGGGGLAALFNDRNTLQLSMFAFLAHSFMAVGAYRILRQVLDGNVGTYPGMRGGGGMRSSRRGAARKYTVEDIAALVRKVPVEEFVSEDEVRLYVSKGAIVIFCFKVSLNMLVTHLKLLVEIWTLFNIKNEENVGESRSF